MLAARKYLSILILVFILLQFLPGCGGGKELAPSRQEEGLSRVLGYFQQEIRELASWWELVALYGAGADLSHWQLPAWEEEDLPPGSDPTLYAGFILGLLARDLDPWEWQGRQLPAELASLQLRNGSFGGSINQTIWAMLALDVAGFSYAGEEALAFLAGEQKEDGGFALSGTAGDPDVTAMALLALSFHRGKPGAVAPVQKALQYLERAMLPSGGYASYDQENANSTAMVLTGLVSQGVDLSSEPWAGLADALLAYQLDDGSFSFFPDLSKKDSMATYQGLLALGDLARLTSVFQGLQESTRKYRQPLLELQPAEPPRAEPGAGPVEIGTKISLISAYPLARILYTLDGGNPLEEGLEYLGPITLEADTQLRAAVLALGLAASPVAVYDFVLAEEPPAAAAPPSGGTEIKPSPEAAISVKVRVVGQNQTHYNGTVKVPVSKANALQALLESKLQVHVTGGFVESIEGERNSGISGWKYKVNSIIPGVSSKEYAIKENDAVIWWYADTPDSTGP